MTLAAVGLILDILGVVLMAAGVADHVWTMEEVVGLLEATETV